MRLPEEWTLLRPGAPGIDPSTGNRKPGAPLEVGARGLLQKRNLTGTSTSAAGGGGEQLSQTAELETFTLLISPDIQVMPRRGDAFRRVSDGVVVQCVGSPRARRPVTGARPIEYYAVQVSSASDQQESQHQEEDLANG